MKGPIVIIGAARSGTKLLRGLIAAHPDVSAVPYDVNYVWLHGHHQLGHDEIPGDGIRPQDARFIARYFAKFAERNDSWVVEKTVSNTLRIRYVRAVFPEAEFIHLLRDGRDVTASAMRQWKAGLDWRSMIPKLATFPYRSAPGYAWRYMRSYVTRVFDRDDTLSTWGPRFPGINAMVLEQPLHVVCAWQWRYCVERSLDDFARGSGSPPLEIRYEDLVTNPRTVTRRIIEHLGLPPSPEMERYYRNTIDPASAGRWRDRLSDQEALEIGEVIGDLNRRLGYERDGSPE